MLPFLVFIFQMYSCVCSNPQSNPQQIHIQNWTWTDWWIHSWIKCTHLNLSWLPISWQTFLMFIMYDSIAWDNLRTSHCGESAMCLPSLWLMVDTPWTTFLTHTPILVSAPLLDHLESTLFSSILLSYRQKKKSPIETATQVAVDSFQVSCPTTIPMCLFIL